MKPYRLAWAVSRCVLGAVTFALVICRFARVGLPDPVLYLLAALDLVALSVTVFARVKLHRGE